MAKDPVCGMDVKEDNAAAKTTFNGNEYFFCSKSCKAEFEKNPEKYVKNESDEGHHGGHSHHGCC
ncbi:YHS domain-containing protein [Thermoanaerobacterium thermosaccharolyticum]|uniref:YHS domain-containing protein n=1 Tax=Thermoanaerobacterium thermosaccharolyticum TaxID=1517 RepID=UPI003D2C16D8